MKSLHNCSGIHFSFANMEKDFFRSNMTKTQSYSIRLEFNTSILKVTALILTAFGFFAFSAIKPACAVQSRIVDADNFRRPANDDEIKPCPPISAGHWFGFGFLWNQYPLGSGAGLFISGEVRGH